MHHCARDGILQRQSYKNKGFSAKATSVSDPLHIVLPILQALCRNLYHSGTILTAPYNRKVSGILLSPSASRTHVLLVATAAKTELQPRNRRGGIGSTITIVIYPLPHPHSLLLPSLLVLPSPYLCHCSSGWQSNNASWNTPISVLCSLLPQSRLQCFCNSCHQWKAHSAGGKVQKDFYPFLSVFTSLQDMTRRSMQLDHCNLPGERCICICLSLYMPTKSVHNTPLSSRLVLDRSGVCSKEEHQSTGGKRALAFLLVPISIP